jgi:hypothetical protein
MQFETTIQIVALACIFACGCERKVENLGISITNPEQVGRGPAEPIVRLSSLLSESGTLEHLQAVFSIPNRRNSPMAIELGERSCSCDKIVLPGHFALPNATSVVVMVLKVPTTAGRKAYWSVLRLAWPDDDYVEDVKCRTELEVLADLVAEPTEVAHDFASESICEQSVTIKNRVRSEAAPVPLRPEFGNLAEEIELVSLELGGKAKLWDSAQGSSQGLGESNWQSAAGEIQDAGTPSGDIWEIEWRAVLRLKATDQVREGYEGRFTVACGRGELSRASVPVRLRCVEPISVSPAHTYFGRTAPNEERTRNVMLRSRDEQEFEIRNILCDSPRFTAHVIDQEHKRLQMIRVTFHGAESGTHEGKLRVATTHPKCSELCLTVEVTVVDGAQVSVKNGQ